MKRAGTVVFLLTLIAAGNAHTQTHAPYAGFQQRQIKALSAEQIDDLRNGRGMGLALAAELNGYPGPAHVIELGSRLELSNAQMQRVQTLFEEMKAEAVPLGERLIAGEAELDRLFSSKSVTPDSLIAATAAIGSIQASLRAAHLKYHLLTLDLLTPIQLTRYAELRGFAGAAAPGHRNHR